MENLIAIYILDKDNKVIFNNINSENEELNFELESQIYTSLDYFKYISKINRILFIFYNESI